ncbi:diguanylate cyclase domain-containing protein [Caenispirillum salinarum]|uniref:GGDEF domain-containing response regulator n=1 Tax=Caenispirillum salinarum TaxID=859058 RepID=UPI00384C4856
MNTQRVLIIDDMLPSARMVFMALQSLEGVEPVVFEDPRAALTWCETNAPDLIITDHIMPSMSGVEFVAAFRHLRGDDFVPTIMLTADTTEDLLVEALEAGSTDFLRKPVFPAELLARTKVMLGLRHKHLRLMEAQSELQRIAMTDSLTGIANRRAFVDRLFSEITRSERSGVPFSVVTVDIDHFKSINDRYGHGGGDQVLCRMADAVGRIVREVDIFGRLGGEEFALLLTGARMGQAQAVAERIRSICCNLRVPVEHDEITFTISAGVAVWQGHGPHALMKEADDALYEAKRTGRNRVVPAATAVPTDEQQGISGC